MLPPPSHGSYCTSGIVDPSYVQHVGDGGPVQRPESIKEQRLMKACTALEVDTFLLRSELFPTHSPVGEAFREVTSQPQRWKRGTFPVDITAKTPTGALLCRAKPAQSQEEGGTLLTSSIQPQLCSCHRPRAQLVFQPLHLDVVELPLLTLNLDEEQGQATGTLGPWEGVKRDFITMREGRKRVFLQLVPPSNRIALPGLQHPGQGKCHIRISCRHEPFETLR